MSTLAHTLATLVGRAQQIHEASLDGDTYERACAEVRGNYTPSRSRYYRLSHREAAEQACEEMGYKDMVTPVRMLIEDNDGSLEDWLTATLK